MKHGSLFSGIGGFDLAAEWMGWENVFHCEWNPFGQKILSHYWPNAISYEDITKTDFTIHRGDIDILTGGFPCQPYSQAGKRLGKEDERHLWPEMLRAIREIAPRWVVGENVRGLLNWNGGVVFDEVQTDLEALGYEVLPFLLPSAGINAPHERYRIWFIAYSDCNGHESGGFNENRPEKRKGESKGDKRERFRPETSGHSGPVTNSISERGNENERFGNGESNEFNKNGSPGDWTDFPTQSPVCNGDDGLSTRLDGITFPKWRNESIKGGGNAIVPQLAYQIFQTIEQMSHSHDQPAARNI